MVRATWVCLLFLVLGSVVPSTALALDFGAGVSVGAVYVGTRAVPAITPHAGVSVQANTGLLFSLQDRPSILPATNRDGVGLYNHLVAALGYTWGNGDIRGGASFTAYFMPACRNKLCGVVAGVGVGADLQLNYFFVGPAGVSVSGNVDWLGGDSLILPGGVAAMAVAGPVVRW